MLRPAFFSPVEFVEESNFRGYVRWGENMLVCHGWGDSAALKVLGGIIWKVGNLLNLLGLDKNAGAMLMIELTAVYVCVCFGYVEC